ncbi:MAG: hypothetical protein SGCHY_004554 [Lobulomycetales sp.]
MKFSFLFAVSSLAAAAPARSLTGLAVNCALVCSCSAFTPARTPLPSPPPTLHLALHPDTGPLPQDQHHHYQPDWSSLLVLDDDADGCTAIQFGDRVDPLLPTWHIPTLNSSTPLNQVFQSLFDCHDLAFKYHYVMDNMSHDAGLVFMQVFRPERANILTAVESLKLALTLEMAPIVYDNLDLMLVIEYVWCKAGGPTANLLNLPSKRDTPVSLLRFANIISPYVHDVKYWGDMWVEYKNSPRFSMEMKREMAKALATTPAQRSFWL